MTTQHYNIPQFPEPYWRDLDLPIFNKLIEDTKVDVAVVGGGITGITAAYLLSKEGLKVAIIDAGRILNGTTGHTTAKVTAQHGLIYDELISHFGQEKARKYYQANSEALHFIQNTVKENNIDCDLTVEDAYLFSTTDQYASKIEKEYQAYEKLGIDGALVDSIPFQIDIKNGLVMKAQAQYHPLKYLVHLVKMFQENGGVIYENTTAIDVEEGNNPKVITRNGKKVECNYVICSSHFPFLDLKGLYFTRLYAERSYAIAVKTEKEYPGGMYLNVEEPSWSLRYTPVKDGKLIILGGGNHKTGQGIDTMQYYVNLEKFGQEVLGIKEYPYRWSAQDLHTLDKIPYIGRITSNIDNIFVATGYRKWGMTNGTAAGMLLSDLILSKQNPYEDLYSPSREVKGDPTIKELISTNLDVAGHLIVGKLEFVPKVPSELSNDEGSVVMVNGKRAGAYRDHEGELHIVDTTCTHMGCELEWNHGDRSWDCPCHGSRFSIKGDVIEGPAEKPLKIVSEE